ncbi:MAG TPA: rhomboid family intramembrane serine protease [Bacteroidetes bacterium]|nr:rhomboid family intramembrane serine protease [Bacteroidota bacterium]
MTILIVAIISLISILAFNNPRLITRLQFNPYRVVHYREYHRFLTHGLIHADWMHLIINMMVLFFFGTAVESYFHQMAEAGMIRWPEIHYLILLVGSMAIATLTTLKKYRNEPGYNSVGASGAVSAFIFTSIFFNPWQTLLLYFIPIPGIIFGIAYLIYSHIMSRRASDHINHDAHFLGAVAGFIYPAIIAPSLIGYFFQQLLNP